MGQSRREFLTASASMGSLLLFGDPAIARRRLLQDAGVWPEDNPFLLGNFRPVQKEIFAEDLKVIGEIPEGLEGMFVRNGPNPQFPPVGNYHWFDGDGMLHGLRIRGGKASYRNRYVRSAGWESEREHGRAIYGGMMDPPSATQIPKGAAPSKNTGNTSVVVHNSKLMALMEGSYPHLISVPELETVGLQTYEGQLDHAFTAHPKQDPISGHMMFFGYSMSPPYVQYKVVNSAGEITHSAEIDIPQPIMMHDFAITSKHSIFLDLPYVFSMDRARQGQPPFAFERGRGSRFGILPRYGSNADVQWFEIENCFVFHVMGAWDEGDDVVILGCRYDQFPDSLDVAATSDVPFKDRIGRDSNAAYLHRWRCNRVTGAVTEQALDDEASEFPQLNQGYCGEAATVGYAMTGSMGGLVRYDLESGGKEVHPHGPGRTGGEGIFVPHPDEDAEEHGWLVTFVHDARTDKSEFVVIDGEDFTAPPVARIQIPSRVPNGFHGTWVPGELMERG